MHTPNDCHSREPAYSAGDGNRRRLTATLVLMSVYMVAEVVGGLLSNSLALLADAGHMLTDVAALSLSVFAIWMARRPPTPTRTYGYYRVEILAALANGAALVAIAIYIFIEAFQRLRNPPEIMGAMMMAVATGGLIVNLAGLWILNAGKAESLNVRGAWLHVMMDTMGSVGAMTSGALILAFGWRWADPAASVLIAVMVVYSSWSLLKESVAVLMEGTPGHIDVDELRDSIASLDDVVEVHDLHVWTITSGLDSLSGHVVARTGSNEQKLLASIRSTLKEGFGIDHITVQIEKTGYEDSRRCD